MPSEENRPFINQARELLTFYQVVNVSGKTGAALVPRMGADTSGRLPVEHRAIHALLAIKYASLGVAVSADGAVMILKTLEIRHSKYDHIERFFNHAKCVLTSGVSADTFLAV